MEDETHAEEEQRGGIEECSATLQEPRRAAYWPLAQIEWGCPVPNRPAGHIPHAASTLLLRQPARRHGSRLGLASRSLPSLCPQAASGQGDVHENSVAGSLALGQGGTARHQGLECVGQLVGRGDLAPARRSSGQWNTHSHAHEPGLGAAGQMLPLHVAGRQEAGRWRGGTATHGMLPEPGRCGMQDTQPASMQNH